MRLIPLTSLILLLAAGCATTPDGDRDYGPAITSIVATGTSIAVQEHPEWRPQFEMAVAGLTLIEQQEKIDFREVLLIVQNLPVKELRSDTGRIIFSVAGIWLSAYDTPEVDVTRIRPIVSALREGFELGLGSVTARSVQSKAGYTAK